jgi:hypothetical protein
VNQHEQTDKIIAASLVSVGAVFGTALTSKIYDARLDEVRKKYEEFSQVQLYEKLYEQLRQRHERFVSQMPNYSDMGLWLDGDKYESWMIEDIKQKYKQ